jgi:hypothetical protein
LVFLHRIGESDFAQFHAPEILALIFYFSILQATRRGGVGTGLWQSLIAAVGLTVISTYIGMLICVNQFGF